MALLAPIFGNKWTSKFGILKHRNLSGQLRTARRSVETLVDRFDFTTRANTQTDALAFRTLFLAAAGIQTTYTDFEGHVWTGYFLPDSLIIKRGRAGCNYELSFKFEGTYV